MPGLAFINSLQPVTYNIDLDIVDDLLGVDKTKKDSLEQSMPKELKEIIKKAREDKQKQVQTGFIAQDVEKTAKNIGYNFSGVDVDESGIYALRYAEFVVPLVKAVQELSEQNEKQQQQIEELTELVNKLLKKEDTVMFKSISNDPSIGELPESPTGNSAALYQNIPNPFSQATQIKFYIPENIKTAQLCIYNLQGKQLKQITISERGKGSQTILGAQFSAGIYLYALLADGKEVDVKRMILTE